MSKSDKEIKKRVRGELDCEADGFDTWLEKNGERLDGFGKSTNNVITQADGTKTRVMPKFAWLFALFAAVLAGVAVGLIFGLGASDATGSPFDREPTFGANGDYIHREMSAEEVERHLNEYPMLGKLFELTSDKQLTEKDGDMAYATFYGDFEASDYYIITIRIVYNDIGFFGQYAYENLTEHAETAAYTVQYRYAGKQEADLFAYYMELQPKNEGRKIYMRVLSFDNEIDYFINNFID